ncbi:MAG: asparagine synthase (glutamine-hydrolyzing) [Deltaproteobacteria bacterium]|nr:MAG: asparagine synthase (glutamine-hydrolyzing) [Deltaproteobacteria bacterium]
MCGIAGIAARGRVERSELVAMAGALAHRGPDGEGVFIDAPFACRGAQWQVGLAHRRLAVLDPGPGAAQPMTSRSGRTSLVLNGEIYNYLELRRLLPGFAWRTRGDAEVMVELLEAYGPAVLERVNGIFAFAGWDRVDRRLWLARDRLGVKPLFYRADANGVAFASELQALLRLPGVGRRIDRGALSAYLDFGFVPEPRSFVQGVEKLSPGSLLTWTADGARVRAWWGVPDPPTGGDFASWREGLYARLIDSVRLQLRSDVPVGTFLSGGVDSTLVTALASRERGAIDSFSVVYPEDPLLDERRFARAAARALGTRHFEVPIRAADVRAAAPELIASIDEPFADSSFVPVQLLSRAARERVTVALSGDGADELFAGYRRYRAERWLARWQRLPVRVRRSLGAGLRNRLRPDRSTRLGELVRRAQKVLASEGLSEAARALALARIFDAADKRRLVPALDEALPSGLDDLRAVRRRVGGRDPLDRQLRTDVCLGLPGDMLAKVDRASMAHGLEVRVPFLDHRVVEHALALPTDRKLRGRRAKPALLDVFGPSLPRVVRRRRKAGFDAPLTGWLRGPLRELVRDTLEPRRIAAAGLLDAASVTQLITDHERGAADHAARIWSLVVLSDWSARHGIR